MDRRKTLKTLLGGAVGTALFTQTGCDNAELVPVSATEAKPKGYGLRTAFEAARDERIRGEQFFTAFERETLGVLADIIAPGTDERPAATGTGIVDFLEFISLDLPEYHQRKLRGGLAWINSESSLRYGGRAFIELDPAERIAIVEDIAWTEEAMAIENNPMLPGVEFFDHLRFLVVTGYFTSKPGVAYLGYEGNQPNFWDGVPQDVLDKHGLAYDPKYLPVYPKMDTQNVIAEWDDAGNLLT